ncbi:MAG: DUF2950 domain-containing protein [Candidatus Rokuibacteriota bacterium]
MRIVHLALALVIGWHAVAVAASGPRRFETLEQAVQALIDATRAGDRQALIDILGPEGQALVASGDTVADRNVRMRFVTEYDAAHRLHAGGGKVILYVGSDDFPFPIPLVPDGPSWRWDSLAGREEVLSRRIGRNELNVIQVCLAYVDAQREYYSQDRNGDGILEYAQRINSSPGKHDGLHWPAKPGEAPSPLGELVVRARAEGYSLAAGAARGPVPYHGYLYRPLMGQGPDAPGGFDDYVLGRHMIGGFGLIAFPASYGVSGVMTFIVNHDGVVYQKDLGPSTPRVAAETKTFNPDRTWQRVDQVPTTR